MAERVLVIDDEPELVHLIAIFLGTAGLEVCSAQDGQQALALLEQSQPDLVICDMVMPTLLALYRRWTKRLSTSEINRILECAVADHHPPSFHGKDIKLFYGTQPETSPPVIVLFSNEPKGIDASYRRYLLRRFRKEFGSGISIRLEIRKR